MEGIRRQEKRIKEDEKTEKTTEKAKTEERRKEKQPRKTDTATETSRQGTAHLMCGARRAAPNTAEKQQKGGTDRRDEKRGRMVYERCNRAGAG